MLKGKDNRQSFIVAPAVPEKDEALRATLRAEKAMRIRQELQKARANGTIIQADIHFSDEYLDESEIKDNTFIQPTENSDPEDGEDTDNDGDDLDEPEAHTEPTDLEPSSNTDSNSDVKAPPVAVLGCAAADLLMKSPSDSGAGLPMIQPERLVLPLVAPSGGAAGDDALRSSSTTPITIVVKNLSSFQPSLPPPSTSNASVSAAAKNDAGFSSESSLTAAAMEPTAVVIGAVRDMDAVTSAAGRSSQMVALASDVGLTQLPPAPATTFDTSCDYEISWPEPPPPESLE